MPPFRAISGSIPSADRAPLSYPRHGKKMRRSKGKRSDALELVHTNASYYVLQANNLIDFVIIADDDTKWSRIW